MRKIDRLAEHQERITAALWSRTGFFTMQARHFMLGIQGLVLGPRWNRKRLQHYQWQRLRSLVHHACREVPFYRELYRGHGVGLQDLRQLSDIQRLPLTSRLDMQRFGEENLLARGIRPSKISMHWTSGSTGEPLRIWRTKSEEVLLAAFRLRSLLQLGVRPGERMASVHFLPETKRPCHKPRLLKNLILPHLEIDCLLEPGEILKHLYKFKPKILAGLPPILDRICEEIEAGSPPEFRPRLIISGAELLSARMRERLERQFAAPVFDRYSAIECRLIASSCPQVPERYHLCEDTLLVEVLKDGRTALPGEVGEIAVTALHSYAMPFIRYRLGDLVRKEETSCPCGSPYATISSICGRLVDRLVKSDGTETHIPLIIQNLPELAPWIRRYQIVQKSPGRITIEILRGQDPGPDIVAALLRYMTDKIDGMEISVDFHPDTSVATTGKFRLFRSEIPGKQSESA